MTDEQKALRTKLGRLRELVAGAADSLQRADAWLAHMERELDRDEPDGDAIGRLMRDEGLDFVTAVERLVQRRLQ